MSVNVLNELRERFGSNLKGSDITAALNAAYSDMSRRATGHKPAIKKKCISVLQDWIDKINEFEPSFEDWHEKACEEFVAAFNEAAGECNASIKGTIGRAQKVINMSFKYLSCIDDRYSKYYQSCHMTLDSYTLNWYNEAVANGKNNKVEEWSKIDDYKKYKEIQDSIRAHLEKGATYSFKLNDLYGTKTIDLPRTPFEAEFVIWEGEIIKERYQYLVKEIENYKKTGKNNDEWLMGNSFTDYLNNLKN